VQKLNRLWNCQLVDEELQRYDDYRAISGKVAVSSFGRFVLAAFVVRHNSIPHQSNAVNSMNPVNPISGYATLGTKSVNI
jgi:hypothetical protein